MPACRPKIAIPGKKVPDYQLLASVLPLRRVTLSGSRANPQLTSLGKIRGCLTEGGKPPKSGQNDEKVPVRYNPDPPRGAFVEDGTGHAHVIRRYAKPPPNLRPRLPPNRPCFISNRHFSVILPRFMCHDHAIRPHTCYRNLVTALLEYTKLCAGKTVPRHPQNGEASTPNREFWQKSATLRDRTFLTEIAEKGCMIIRTVLKHLLHECQCRFSPMRARSAAGRSRQCAHLRFPTPPQGRDRNGGEGQGQAGSAAARRGGRTGRHRGEGAPRRRGRTGRRRGEGRCAALRGRGPRRLCRRGMRRLHEGVRGASAARRGGVRAFVKSHARLNANASVHIGASAGVFACK